MSRSQHDKWLDDALTDAIGSDRPTTGFEQWRTRHPQAAEMLTARGGGSTERTPKIWSIIMTSPITKLAAAAVVAVAAVLGVHQLISKPTGLGSGQLVRGPQTVTLDDGSTVELADGAAIRTDSAGSRGFEHTAGRINVDVAKGKGQFIVATAYGSVKALGTEFALDLVDGVAVNTKKPVRLLSVNVTEGTVEVSNKRGSRLLSENQGATVMPDSAPFACAGNQSIPAGLAEKVAAMQKAMESGDSRAYFTNYNLQVLFDMVKGSRPYDANLFGGDEVDLGQLKEAFADVQNPQELLEKLMSGPALPSVEQVYVQSVKLNDACDHATAEIVMLQGGQRLYMGYPQWHLVDGQWWQIDD